MSICTSSVSQYAALAALESSEEWLAARRRMFAERLEWVSDALAEALVPTIRPDAWPVLLLDTRLIHPDDERAAAMLAENAGVRVEPGSRYGSSCAGFVAIRLDASEESLRAGIDRLRAFHNSCR
jgi:bifunctional pyridoxal-dependent enzyme with beta-cystathionase and maltose regulon repressor activities